jgi:hypothetical protein
VWRRGRERRPGDCGAFGRLKKARLSEVRTKLSGRRGAQDDAAGARAAAAAAARRTGGAAAAPVGGTIVQTL